MKIGVSDDPSSMPTSPGGQLPSASRLRDLAGGRVSFSMPDQAPPHSC